MKYRVTVYVDEEVYKEFKIQSILLGKKVSTRVNEYMKDEVKKGAAK